MDDDDEAGDDGGEHADASRSEGVHAEVRGVPTLRGRIGVIAKAHVHVVRREATIIGRAVRAG